MVREEPETQRFFAQMLLDRDHAGDRERAASLLRAAVDGYTTFGVPQHAALTRAIAANL